MPSKPMKLDLVQWVLCAASQLNAICKKPHVVSQCPLRCVRQPLHVDPQITARRPQEQALLPAEPHLQCVHVFINCGQAAQRHHAAGAAHLRDALLPQALTGLVRGSTGIRLTGMSLQEAAAATAAAKIQRHADMQLRKATKTQGTLMQCMAIDPLGQVRFRGAGGGCEV